MSRSKYDPRKDPELDDEQREEATIRSSNWVAFPADADDRAEWKRWLPDAAARDALEDAWAFAHRRRSNGVVSAEEAEEFFGAHGGSGRFEAAGLLARHNDGWRLVDYLRFNFTKAQRDRRRIAQSEAGKRGGDESGITRRTMRDRRNRKPAKPSLPSETRSDDRVKPADRSTETESPLQFHVGKGISGPGSTSPPSFVKRYRELVADLRSLRVTGKPDDFYIACPVHRGDGDTCHVTIREGRINAHCFKCRANGKAVAAARGFKNGDLFERELDRRPRGSPRSGSWTRFEIRDCAGQLIAIQERFDFVNVDGEPKKEFRWTQPDGAKGLRGMSQSDLPFFGSEQLVPAQHPNGLPIVVLVEGAKKAAKLNRSLPPGFLALGTVTGSGAPHSVAVCRTLAGVLEVIVWPDNDEEGDSNARKLAENLHAAGIDPVRFVGPTGVPDSGDDCADFIDENPATASNRIEDLLRSVERDSENDAADPQPGEPDEIRDFEVDP